MHRDLTISNFRTSLFEDETHNTRPVRSLLSVPLPAHRQAPYYPVSHPPPSLETPSGFKAKRFPSLVKALKAVKPHINHNISRTLFYQTNIS